MKPWKRLGWVLLTLALCLTLCPAGLAEETVTPAPPAWCPEEEYVVFEGDSVYEPENWAKIEVIRAHAESGKSYDDLMEQTELYDFWKRSKSSKTNTPGLAFETALIGMQYMRNAENTAAQNRTADRAAYLGFSTARKALEEGSAEYGIAATWDVRAYLVTYYSGTAEFSDSFLSFLTRMLNSGATTLEQVYNSPFLDCISAERREELDQALEAYAYRRATEINLTLDGDTVTASNMGAEPESKNGRTMIPIRHVAELLGAVVEWDNPSQTVTMTRAGAVVSMTIGETTAYVNGTAMEMDVAPYATEGRTLIPARYMAEFFGQSVVWDSETRTVVITEEKSAAGSSNLEAWALPMGAMLSRLNGGDITLFGLYPRNTRVAGEANGPNVDSITPAERGRMTLQESWSINSRADLIETVCSMTEHGHNDSFLADVAYIDSLTTAEYNQYLNSDSMDSYMFPYTKQLSEKWGDRGILCWDLFRMSNLVQWGYLPDMSPTPRRWLCWSPPPRG